MRYVYATYRSRENAEAALEHMFAAGEVSEGERPRIKCRNGRYSITLEG